MDSPRTRLTTAAFVVASLIGGALVAAFHHAGAETPAMVPAEGGRSLVAGKEEPRARVTHARTGEGDEVSKASDGGAHADGSDRVARVREDGFRPEDLYAPPRLGSDGTFEEETPEPSLAQACARYDGPVRTGLGAHIRALGFAPRYVTPADVHVVDWNRHLRLGEDFLQVSVVWNQDLPATYAVSARRGPSPVALDTALPPDDGPAPAGVLDVVEALARAERIVARLEAQGAVAGARTMILTDRVFDPARVVREAPRRAEFRNGALVAYQDAAIACGEGAEGFLCDCPLP